MESRRCFLFLLPFFLVFSSSVFGQKADSLSLQALSDMGYEMEKQNLLDSAISIYNQVIIASQLNKYPVLEGRNKRYIGMIYSNIGELDLAETYYQQAFNLFERTNTVIDKGKVITDLGNLYNMQGQYLLATEWYYKGIEIYEQLQDPRALSILYGNIGVIHFEMDDMRSAIEKHELALEYAKAANDSIRMVAALANIGSAWDNEGDDLKAIRYFQQAMDFTQNLEAPHQVSYLYNNVASIYLQLDSIDLAIAYGEKALALTPTALGKMSFKITLGTYYHHNNEFEKAYKLLKEALEEAIKLNYRGLEADALAVLADFEEQKMNYEQSLSYYKSSNEIKDSLEAEAVQAQIHELQIKYPAAKKEKENQRLRAENAEQELLLVRSNIRAQRQFWMLLLLGVVLAGFLISFWLYRKNIQNQQALLSKDARLKEEQLKQLQKEQTVVALKAMMAGEETERKRLSRDLHDGLGSLLSTIKLSLTDTGAHTVNLVDKASHELRRIAHNLMPESLSRFGLLKAIEDMVDEINYNGNLHVDLQVIGEPKHLPANYELPLYRIIQELLNNILKHAAATEVFLQLLYRDEQLFVIVEDNGRGFDAKTLNHRKGAGLQNIQSRMEYLNGQFDMESEIGKGTTANLRISLK